MINRLPDMTVCPEEQQHAPSNVCFSLHVCNGGKFVFLGHAGCLRNMFPCYCRITQRLCNSMTELVSPPNTLSLADVQWPYMPSSLRPLLLQPDPKFNSSSCWEKHRCTTNPISQLNVYIRGMWRPGLVCEGVACWNGYRGRDTGSVKV